MIGCAVDDESFPAEVSDDPSHIGEQSRSDFGLQQWPPFFGGEDHVGQQVCEGLCHSPAPLQGLLGFVDVNPGLVALGYYPPPLRGSV